MPFTLNLHAKGFTAHGYSNFATVEISDGGSSTADVFLNTPEACDDLIRAAMQARSMLLGETSEPVEVNVSASLAAEIGEALAAVERGETEDLGSFAQYADLDAQLSPPATPGHHRDRPPTGYQLPAAARCDGVWSTGAASGQCVDVPHSQGQCTDAAGHKFAYRASLGTGA